MTQKSLYDVACEEGTAGQEPVYTKEFDMSAPGPDETLLQVAQREGTASLGYEGRIGQAANSKHR